MLKKLNFKVGEMTYISIGIAAMISGGIIIFQISTVVPLPGLKYILMAPYLSMIIYILLSIIQTDFAILKIGCVFGLLMSFINLFMGVAIVITALLTQFSIMFLDNYKKKVFLGAILFSGYTGVCAVAISKYLVGEALRNISNWWLVLIGITCIGFGSLGTVIASKIVKQIKFSNRS
jgi:energy-coupling factor transport system substrate-specific component